MPNMPRHTQSQSHSYSFQRHTVAAPKHRYSAPHSNSSAFSASANANEDWTKISDLGERRRIQNRIAQRNYRKKQKQKMEELERRVASSSRSPEPSPTELDDSRGQQQRQHRTQQKPQQRCWPSLAAPSNSQQLHTPDSSYPPASTTHRYQGQHSRSPTPMPMPYASFASQDSTVAPIFPFSSYQSSYTSATSDAPSYGNYLTPKNSKTTSIASLEESTVKLDPYETDELNNPFSVTYAPAVALGESSFSPNQYSPPLSFSESFSDNTLSSSVMDSPPELWGRYPTPQPSPGLSISGLNEFPFFTLDPNDDTDFLSLLPSMDDQSFLQL